MFCKRQNSLQLNNKAWYHSRIRPTRGETIIIPRAKLSPGRGDMRIWACRLDWHVARMGAVVICNTRTYTSLLY